jgi:hypothetical protein
MAERRVISTGDRVQPDKSVVLIAIDMNPDGIVSTEPTT